MYYYYRLVSNNGYGDAYYCMARDITEAREICGLEPKLESKAIGHRVSRKEYDQAKPGYAVHIH